MNSRKKSSRSEEKKQKPESKKDSISTEMEELIHEIEMRNEALKKIFHYFEKKKTDEKDS